MRNRIFVFVDSIRYEEKSIITALRNRKLPMSVRSISSLPFSTANVKMYNKAIAIVRIPAFFKSTTTASMLGSAGATVINPPENLYTFGRKSRTDLWLANRGLPNIEAYLAISTDAALSAAGKLGYPVVVKPDIGGFGRRVHLVENSVQLLQLAETIMDLATPYNRFIYIQKFIDFAHDLRLVVLNGRILAIMERFKNGSFSKNISQGGYGNLVSMSMVPANLVKQLKEHLPFGLYGVDVLLSSNGVIHICEINANCQFKEFEKVTGVNVGERLVDELEKLMSPKCPKSMEKVE
ncbi:MAG: RimK family alpha-L-glutamate ligase [Bacteroidota bacterium]